MARDGSNIQLLLHSMRALKALFAILGGVVGRNYHHGERNLVAVSVCGAFGMPLYYFVWHDLFPQPYEYLTLRLLGGALCLPLTFKDHWPEAMRRYAPVLWYVTVLYVLPFFFTYMTLRRSGWCLLSRPCCCWFSWLIGSILLFCPSLAWRWHG